MKVKPYPSIDVGRSGLEQRGMKLSWIFVIALLFFVAVFSVQNAVPITMRFLTWQFAMSAALVIQVAALLCALVGLVCGACSRGAARRHALPPAQMPPPRDVEPGSVERLL